MIAERIKEVRERLNYSQSALGGAGIDQRTLARMMGHADITVLRVYLELIDTDGEAAHQKHGVVDRL